MQKGNSMTTKKKPAPKKKAVKGAAGGGQAALLDGTVKPFVETVIKKLRVPVNEKRELEIRREVGQTEDEMIGLQAARKKATSEFDEKIKVCKGHISKLKDHLESGELKPVKVDVSYAFKEGSVSETRQDTGEVSTRPMVQEDRVKAQAGLELGDLQTRAGAVDTTPAEGAGEAAAAASDGGKKDKKEEKDQLM